MEANDPEREAALTELTTLKIPHEKSWTTQQLQGVLAKQKAKIAAVAKAAEPAPKAKPAPAPAPDAGVEGDDGDAAEAAFMAERNELLAAKDALTARVTELEAANAKLNEKLLASNAALFDLEAAKSVVDTELFDLRLKAAGGTENATPTEDFGGPKEGVAKPRAVRTAATVMCRVTKAGDGQIFTGKDQERYKRNDVCEFPAETAAALEAKGWVETD
jgi:hypothetical protein